MPKGHRYPAEVRAEAVRLVAEEGMTIRAVCLAMGLKRGAVSSRVRADAPDAAAPSPCAAQLREVREELARRDGELRKAQAEAARWREVARTALATVDDLQARARGEVTMDSTALRRERRLAVARREVRELRRANARQARVIASAHPPASDVDVLVEVES